MSAEGLITLGLGSSPGSVTPFLLFGLNVAPVAQQPSWLLAPVATGHLGARRPSPAIGSQLALRRPSAVFGANIIGPSTLSTRMVTIIATGTALMSDSETAIAKLEDGIAGQLLAYPVIGAGWGIRRPAPPFGRNVVGPTTLSTYSVIVISEDTAVMIDDDTAVGEAA